MSYKIGFDPTSDKWVLSDGEHYLEVPHWAREIIADEFERETRQLKAENTELRESVKRLMTQRDERLARAEADNAELWELVRTFYHCTTSGECDECPINGGGPVHLMPDTICDTIHDRMGELGVDA